MLTCSVSIPVFEQSAQQVSLSHNVDLKMKQRFRVTEDAENRVRREGDEGGNSERTEKLESRKGKKY